MKMGSGMTSKKHEHSIKYLDTGQTGHTETLKYTYQGHAVLRKKKPSTQRSSTSDPKNWGHRCFALNNQGVLIRKHTLVNRLLCAQKCGRTTVFDHWGRE